MNIDLYEFKHKRYKAEKSQHPWPETDEFYDS